MARANTLLVMALCLFLCASSRSAAQSNPLDKKLQKAQEMVDNDKLDDAEKYMEKVLDENPDWADGWDALASVRYMQYKNAKPLQINLTTKDSTGKDVQATDTLSQKLMAMLNKLSLPKIAYSKYVYTLRKATCMSRDAVRSSMTLRRLYVDVDVDSNVSKKALKYFNEAETEFSDKNYSKAATLYKRATEEQPNFYKAQMYLGDCHYAMKNYTEAIVAFRSARERFPYLLEPCKYLTDALAKLGQYDKSYEEAVRSTTIYPDCSMFMKLDDAAYLMGKKVDIQWTQRDVLPNRIRDTSKEDINTYNDRDSAADGSPWKYYQEAFTRVSPYCNEKGIITKSNGVTNGRYLELYSWEEMLKKSNDPKLNEARRMQKQNYLDCYVFITCFHYDFYDQYIDFVAHNRDKVTKYFEAFTRAR